jgi:hypothetical protein
MHWDASAQVVTVPAPVDWLRAISAAWQATFARSLARTALPVVPRAVDPLPTFRYLKGPCGIPQRYLSSSPT